jgi:hypothetical protein
MRDLWYWLELLKMRVREPKFLLVATNTEHTPPDLNLTDIKRAYAGCQGCFPVELGKLEGFDALQTRILELAAESPAMRALWPAAWLPVRDEVRRIRQDQPYMTPAGFRGLMKNKGVTTEESQHDLATQLHDLGEILYFQDRDELSGLVILNPEWVTELIALVVRSEDVRRHGGMLRSADLDELWKKADLEPTVRAHLISLMDRFDLTYSTGHRKDVGIVVEALPYATTEDLKGIDLAPDRPRMEMIYRFPSLERHLPPGVPTWGIARAHRFIKRKPWRDAAAFEDPHTESQALILASDREKEVRLRVAADYPPFFFGQMQAILLDTFKRYPGAAPERRVPCNCQPACPHSYEYETVLAASRDSQFPYLRCEQPGKRSVDARSLLSGFKPATPAGVLALESEMRRGFTEQLRAQNERMEKTCPSVFTLVPSKGFKQLDTWMEYATQKEELELALYCEHESGWHATSHSLYRFRPEQEWFDLMKAHWNQFVKVSKQVGPLASLIGKAAGVQWAELAAGGIEKVPELSREPANALASTLGEKAMPELIDIETRYLLERLIDHLDSERPDIEPKGPRKNNSSVLA